MKVPAPASFRDPALLTLAFTHRSHAHEHGGAFNERLEFLGDAVLQLCATELLYERHPEASEGDLSRMRGQLVSTEALARLAQGSPGLAQAAALGRGEDRSGGRERPRFLAGLYEAVLGAVYLDRGLDAARALVRDDLAGLLPGLEGRVRPRTALQEWCQRTHGGVPQYVVVSTSGPDHAQIFVVEVRLAGETLGSGEGANKREASARAAQAGLDALRQRGLLPSSVGS